MIGVNILKNKVLTTFMATAITATIVWPVPTTHAAFGDLSTHQSQYNAVQTAERVAAIPSGETSLTITNVTADAVRTTSGQLTSSKSLKPIFKAANRQALLNAKATVVVKNGEITEIKALTLNNAGTNKKSVVFDGGDAKISGSVTASADYLKIQNVTIAKELIVTNRIKNAITIDSVAIGDTITFKPLLAKKINWLNVSLKDIVTPEINVQRNKLKLAADQLISIINVTDDVSTLDVEADVGKLVIDVKKNFSLYGQGKMEQAVVKRGANITLDAYHHINKVQVDDKKANVTYSADKTTLNKYLASIPYVAVSVNGNDILSTEKWTTQAHRSLFDSAVISARAIANDTTASQKQVDDAYARLDSALVDYQAVQKFGTKYAYGDKSALTSLINSVQYVTVSWSNGSELSYNTAWTTQSEKDTLVSAVSSAQSVVNNYYATQDQVASAINNLNNAITIYKNAYKYGPYGNGYYGDKSTLTSLLTNISYVAISYSGNGQDVTIGSKWTTLETYNTFYNAVTSAQYVKDYAFASQEQINSAITSLQNAINTYSLNQYGPRYY